MKITLKFLLFAVVSALVLTFAQASTFVGVWEVEREFLTQVWVSPRAWLGSIVLWKYVVVLAAILSVVVAAIITLIRKSASKRKLKNGKRAPTREEAKVLNNETTSGVVHSGKAKTSAPRGFTRVTPKK